MFGFFQDQKDKPKRERLPAKAKLEDIPVTLLREQSCSVCPRDKGEMRTPKMKPTGSTNAPIYLLGESPSPQDDNAGEHWRDRIHAEVYAKFGKTLMREDVRSNYTVQCHGDRHVVVTECCRGRIIEDIERTKPIVVVTVGDEALHWATGVTGTAVQYRGLLIVSKIGNHVCYVYPLIKPHYALRDRERWHGALLDRSSYDRVMHEDVKWLKQNYLSLPPVRFHAGPYDAGIDIITGDQPGDMQRLQKRLVEIAQYPRSALDIETTGLRPYMQRHPAILTACVGTFKDSVAFPLKISSAGHDEGWGTTAREQQAMQMFGEYMQASGRKACHNLAFEMEWLEHEYGGQILRRTEWDDTMAATYVLDGRQGIKSLDAQTRIHFGFFLKDQSPVNVKQEQWWLPVRLKDILRYNGMDTKWTDLLRDTRAEDFKHDSDARKVYEQRMRLAPTLVLTEAPGLLVDVEYTRKLDKEMRASMADTEAKLARCKEVQEYERKHGHFDPAKPEQVLLLMHGMLKRKECEREDLERGVIYTTDNDALGAIPRSTVPSARLVLDHREVAKLHGTYVHPALQKKWICRDGRIRSKYNALKAITGRLSSEDPNQQNWPNRKNREVRGMIVAERNRWLVPFDYGQIEFRVVAMASHDKNLMRYCWTQYDVHKYWAERVVKVYPEIKDYIVEEFEVDWDEKGIKTLRQEMKNRWVFPQLFGSTTRSCARNLHIPDDIAKDLGEEFWDEFAGVKEWQQGLIEFYDKNLYVETLGKHKRRGAMTVNELINHPIQGTAAEIVQEAQIALSERAELEDDPELQPILNVHDDLTFDIGDDTLEPKIGIIAREMCKVRFDYINVPLVVEVKIGSRWDRCEEFKVYRSNELFGTRNPYEEKA